jgi:ribosomal protein S12 methylthiotransferase accessory factor
LLKRPAFRPEYTVALHEPTSVLLIAESRHYLLHGRLYLRLAALIDGQRTTGEVAGELADKFSLIEVMTALLQLEQEGHLVEATSTPPTSTDAFWSALDQPPAQVAATLPALALDVRTFGLDPDVGPLFVEAVAAIGLTTAEPGATATLKVALADDYEAPTLGEPNDQALLMRQPWVLVKPVGRTVWIGPLLRPGRTGCWRCLAHRLAGSHPIEHLAQNHAVPIPQTGAIPFLPTTLRLALNLAATVVAQALLAPAPGLLDGRLLSLDLGTMETTWHALVRWPLCPACATPAEDDPFPAPLALESRSWLPSGTMGHREARPEGTLRRYGHHHSPIIGIVSLLQRTMPADEAVIHTYASRHSTVVPAENLSGLRDYLRETNGGKGTTDLQARVSALAEALERYSGSFQGNERRRRATIADLGDAAIHPTSYLLYSDRQYAEREAWNKRGLRFQSVPDPFDEDRAVDWTPIWSLTRREVRYLPTALCYYRFPSPPGEAIGRGDSNGCAAGNSREEAILQGLLELVERDSTALWWYNRVHRPEIDLDTFDDPYVQQLRHVYLTRGREVWALDLTSDLGIPVVAGCSRRAGGEPEEILVAFGAHLDPRIAIRRALTEINQLLPALDQSSKELRARRLKPDSQLDDWLQRATFANQPHLRPDLVRSRSLTDLPNLAHGDIREEIERCQAILEARGLELLVLDQTRPDVEMPVVKVVVPGLRYVWARFAPGRLYDVPVQISWLAAPRDEDSLNPFLLPL